MFPKSLKSLAQIMNENVYFYDLIIYAKIDPKICCLYVVSIANVLQK